MVPVGNKYNMEPSIVGPSPVRMEDSVRIWFQLVLWNLVLLRTLLCQDTEMGGEQQSVACTTPILILIFVSTQVREVCLLLLLTRQY